MEVAKQQHSAGIGSGELLLLCRPGPLLRMSLLMQSLGALVMFAQCCSYKTQKEITKL